jgi:hypothetical protein
VVSIALSPDIIQASALRALFAGEITHKNIFCLFKKLFLKKKNRKLTALRAGKN